MISSSSNKNDHVFSVTTIWEGTSDSSVFLVSTKKLRENGEYGMADELESCIGKRGDWADFKFVNDACTKLEMARVDQDPPIMISGTVFGYLG